VVLRIRNTRLRKLTLRNFQRHKRIEIVLDPKITTIIGDTDTGKTSLIRALYWVTHNRPAGSGIIRKGSLSCRVSLTVGKTVISRTKGKKGNTYKIGDQTLTAFGNDVPSVVKDCLKIEEVNFQHQFDSLFWLAESPTQVSKNINEIVNLGAIDSSQNYINKEVRNTKAEIRVHEERIKKLKEQKKKSAWIIQAVKDMKVIQKEAKSLQKLEALESSLSRSVSDRLRLRAEHRKRLAGANQTSLMMSELSKLRKLTAEQIVLSMLIISIQKDRKKLIILDTKILTISKAKEEMEKVICPKCGRKLRS